MPIVYVVTNPAMPDLVKIGRTDGDSADLRLGQLYTTGVPFPFKLEFACVVSNPAEVEVALHTAFAPYRVNPRREFFKIDPVQAIAILKLLHGVDTTAALALQPTGAQPEEVAAGETYEARRPVFRFDEMGIPIGAVLTSTISDVTATVLAPRRVLFNGQDSSLSAATKAVLGLDYLVQPGPYWRYEGRLLRDIYNETYPAVE